MPSNLHPCLAWSTNDGRMAGWLYGDADLSRREEKRKEQRAGSASDPPKL